MKLFIYPRASYSYATYYIYGLEQVFGKEHISYDVKPFKKLNYDSRRDLGNFPKAVICNKWLSYVDHCIYSSL